MFVSAILKQKGREIVSVRPTLPVEHVARLLSERGIGAVLVLDAASQVLGILSERDIVHAIARHGPSALAMTAAQLMTVNLTTATPETTECEALESMTTGRFRHLPVLDGGSLVGLISIGDVVKARITEQEAEVNSLKAYVAGAA